MKIRLSTLKRIIKEENVAPAGMREGGSTNLGKLLDEMTAQFTSKMQSQFPNANDVIQKEAQDLKTQLTAQIKASAAKIKMSAKPS